MLRPNELNAMDKKRRELSEQKKAHLANGDCSGQDKCPVCQGIKERLKEMDDIASDAWRF